MGIALLRTVESLENEYGRDRFGRIAIGGLSVSAERERDFFGRWVVCESDCYNTPSICFLSHSYYGYSRYRIPERIIERIEEIDLLPQHIDFEHKPRYSRR